MTGTLIGIAVRPARRTPMEERSHVSIDKETGLDGDHAGKHPKRIVTILSRAGWQAALEHLDPFLDLPWTTRRANLLVDGIDLPRAAGAIITVGAVTLEVTGETVPCSRMDEAREGLRKALAQDWRGGVICSVTEPGDVRIGDPVDIPYAPEPRTRHLP